MEDKQGNAVIELDNFDDFLQSEDNELIDMYSQHIDLIKKNSERIKKVACKYDLPILEYEKGLRLIDQYKRNYEDYFSPLIGCYAVDLNKFDSVKARFDERNAELKKAKKMFKRCKKVIEGTIKKIEKEEEASSNKGEKSTRPTFIVMLEVAETINKEDKFLPLTWINRTDKLAKYKKAIFDRFGFNYSESAINNNIEKDLTNTHRLKVIKMLNEYGFMNLAKQYQMQNKSIS